MPPPSVLGRAVTWQGLCCTIAGLFGTANGTTAYNENIGAMQVELTSKFALIPNVDTSPMQCSRCLSTGQQRRS